ncbi:Hypothetical predicted protein [Mytilus galloprovincialis]|uniref:SAM domain-containing protein n=1 Tax=Mytilus galloprovincialis TaxID=29158 RepID=A0A8B6BFM9_MYTGA|nr:Hypothetical predicted protein [Mytilus galloprovincialis]
MAGSTSMRKIREELNLTEQQLIRLGVTTIGDRIRLEEKVKQVQRSNINENEPTVETLASDIRSQRNILFGRNGGGRGRGRQRSRTPNNINDNKREKGSRSWTVTVVCVPDKDATKPQTTQQKEVNFKAGLVEKRICFSLDDNESAVMDKISSDIFPATCTSDNADGKKSLGFPQLKTSGGFELLKCRQNCRELCLIDCQWNAGTLKSYLGAQAKIYVRPIQKCLSTKPVNENSVPEQSQMFTVRELRNHLQTCISQNSDSESDDLPDPQIGPDKNSDIEEQHNLVDLTDQVNETESANVSTANLEHHENSEHIDIIIEKAIEYCIENKIQWKY